MTDGMYSIELGDWPGSALTAMDCAYPEAPDGGLDLVLPVRCSEHERAVWWCLNAAVLWCDGGPPDYRSHDMGVHPLLDILPRF